MTAGPAPRRGWELLAGQVNQRRYEALRAYLFQGASLQQAADATGYTRDALASLVRDLRVGKLTVFAPPGVPGRKSAPKTDAARARVIELRRDGRSIHEISTRLSQEGTPLGPTAVSGILRKEGFGRLLRGPVPEPTSSPGTGPDTRLPAAAVIDFAAFPARVHTTMAGLLLAIPEPGRPRPARPGRRGPLPRDQDDPRHCLSAVPARPQAHRYPARVPRRRTAHRPRPLHCSPPCRSCRRRPRSRTTPTGSPMTTNCGSWPRCDKQMIAKGLVAGEAIFDLDFHAVMHWGHDPALEKHHVPTALAAHPVSADLLRPGLRHPKSGLCQRRPVQGHPGTRGLAFCDHWKAVCGADPVHADLRPEGDHPGDPRRARRPRRRFATFRMRSPSLVKRINALTASDYNTVALDRPGPYNRPKVHETAAVKLTSYPGTVRQLIVVGLGRAAPTVIITNDTRSPPRP